MSDPRSNERAPVQLRESRWERHETDAPSTSWRRRDHEPKRTPDALERVHDHEVVTRSDEPRARVHHGSRRRSRVVVVAHERLRRGVASIEHRDHRVEARPRRIRRDRHGSHCAREPQTYGGLGPASTLRGCAAIDGIPQARARAHHTIEHDGALRHDEQRRIGAPRRARRVERHTSGRVTRRGHARELARAPIEPQEITCLPSGVNGDG